MTVVWSAPGPVGDCALRFEIVEMSAMPAAERVDDAVRRLARLG